MDARSRAVPALVWHDAGRCGTALRTLQPSSPDLDSGSIPLWCLTLKRWWLWHGFVFSSAVIPHLMRDPFRCLGTSRHGAVPLGNEMVARSRAVLALVWHDGGEIFLLPAPMPPHGFPSAFQHFRSAQTGQDGGRSGLAGNAKERWEVARFYARPVSVCRWQKELRLSRFCLAERGVRRSASPDMRRIP